MKLITKLDLKNYHKILILFFLLVMSIFLYNTFILKTHSSFYLEYLNNETSYDYYFEGRNLKTLTLKMEKYDSQVLKNSYPLGKIKYLKNKDDQGIIKLKESKDSLKRIKLSMRINSEHFINYGEVGILDTEIDLNGFEYNLIDKKINVNKSSEFELIKFQKNDELYIVRIKVEFYE